MALAVAFIRAIVRRRGKTLGNFWVDPARSTTRILIRIAFVFAIVLMSQGVIDNFHASTTVTASDATDWLQHHPAPPSRRRGPASV
jgi:potassium-transporting ATPase potassium-binding subunit